LAGFQSFSKLQSSDIYSADSQIMGISYQPDKIDYTITAVCS